ncbi:carboxyl-terminal processing protease [Peptoniphilus asaccharolyticus DSM 20463]|uniref:Carboxyl-terminal processing protease n=1 Tax=Peptoniphilus asaccharolyticus DSM 20463 TaxID=573058 RepID=A0A1W1UIW6_PEPAS|nr:S41 family peptidase [Peptoniphilus asaccharolyticus]MBL7574797.1 S41 family peptidase [Peptoniphilus asaccharolyticus]SMB81046.1 carboxyl-terminal processing protease [Peptoniphilus asaccharolyticus DSM 20463]
MKKILKIVTGIMLLLVTNFFTFVMATGGFIHVDRDKYTQLAKLESFVKQNYLYDVNEKQLLNGELKGLVAGLKDPYSEYYTREEYDRLMEFTTGKFYGIGVVITRGEDNLITVISPIKDSPADLAGIKAGDKILKVGDEEFTGDKLQEATNVMKGDKGTDIKITVLKKDSGKTEDLTIKRDEIKVDTVHSQIIDDIGYIGITQFDDTTGKDFEKALRELEKKEVKGLILDLRRNPGGVVDTAAHIADLLLPKGIIVYAEDKNGKRDFEFNSDENHYDKPIVVLVNEGSASASELLSGALRDYKRATIVGKNTFGKGIVQTANRFPNGDGIKLTTSEYFLPSGKSIHKLGVKPDVEVELNKDTQGIGPEFKSTDNQLQKAIEILDTKIEK